MDCSCVNAIRLSIRTLKKWFTLACIFILSRSQGRWNGDAWDVTNGNNNGMIEMDPGAWLLPYWLARYYGLITADE